MSFMMVLSGSNWTAGRGGDSSSMRVPGRFSSYYPPSRMATRRARVAKSLVRFRVDLPGGRSIGPGKVRLLELLDQHGSISEAARRMRMSYRQAWVLLDDLNAAFDRGLFETATGGTRGGGTRLTPLGHRVMAAYRELQDAIDALARRTVSD